MSGTKFPAVYCARIPFDFESREIRPQQRAAEISAARCEKVRVQKFFAWKLLEHALAVRLGLTIDAADIIRGENGKWFCRGREDCFFSLSHTDGAVAAAVSQRPCGVDIERFVQKRFLSERLAERILCPEEKKEYAAILPYPENLHTAAEKKSRYAALKWTQKESIFKMRDGDTFVPSKIDTLNNAWSADNRDSAGFFLDSRYFAISEQEKAGAGTGADGNEARGEAEKEFFLTVCGETLYGEKPEAEFFVYGSGMLYNL